MGNLVAHMHVRKICVHFPCKIRFLSVAADLTYASVPYAPRKGISCLQSWAGGGVQDLLPEPRWCHLSVGDVRKRRKHPAPHFRVSRETEVSQWEENRCLLARFRFHFQAVWLMFKTVWSQICMRVAKPVHVLVSLSMKIKTRVTANTNIQFKQKRNFKLQSSSVVCGVNVKLQYFIHETL